MLDIPAARVLGLLALLAGPAPGPPTAATGNPELDPLASYLKASYAEAIRAGRPLLIADTINLGALFFGRSFEEFEVSLLKRASEQFPAELIQDFAVKNREAHPVRPELARHLSAQLLTGEEAKKIFGEGRHDGWDRFYVRYPKAHGILTVSRVGLNRVQDLAFFYVGWASGSLSALGQLHVLRKEGDAWVEVPVKGLPLWMS